MKKYIPFTKAYAGDNDYEIVCEVLNKRKESLRIPSWVEMEDIYVDDQKDLFFVELYNTEYSREEGHGFHDVPGVSVPVSYERFMSREYYERFMSREYLSSLRKEYAECEEEVKEETRMKPAHAILAASMIIVLVWAAMWIVCGSSCNA